MPANRHSGGGRYFSHMGNKNKNGPPAVKAEKPDVKPKQEPGHKSPNKGRDSKESKPSAVAASPAPLPQGDAPQIQRMLIIFIDR